jgi:hypothetical protein
MNKKESKSVNILTNNLIIKIKTAKNKITKPKRQKGESK